MFVLTYAINQGKRSGASDFPDRTGIRLMTKRELTGIILVQVQMLGESLESDKGKSPKVI